MFIHRAPSRAVLLATLLLAPQVGAQASSTGASASAQEPAPGLTRFYDQQLAFGPCERYAMTATDAQIYDIDGAFECARLEVPLDYEKPDGRVMQIGVLRVLAKGAPEERIGSLVINPGGPGGAGMVQGAVVALSLIETPIVQHFDIVGFDPRGVGASTPAISCFTDKELDEGTAQTTLMASSGEWSENDTRTLMEKCAEGSGGKDVLAAVGTRNAARDMDVLRAALGDDQLTFAGQSYGTRLGPVYAEMFPQNVRAMVLDGVIDPRQTFPERRAIAQASFQRSFDLMAEFCAQSSDCPLGTDPGQATTVFQDLVQPLIDTPVPAGKGRMLNFNQTTGSVSAGLYYSQVWPDIIAGLAQLKNEGRGDKLTAIGDQFGGSRDSNGVWNNFLESNLAVNCNDEERRTPKEEADLRRSITEASPFLETGREVDGVSRDSCEFWPSEPTLGFPYAQNVEGLPEVLIISITGDPSTPYDAAFSLADSIGGTVLTVEGEQHTIAQSGASPCVNEIVTNYLINLELPDEGTRCVL